MYKLTIISGPNRGTSFALQDGEITLGRQGGNAIVLNSSKVSKKHCMLAIQGAEIVIRDLGSSNGTFVNGGLSKARRLYPGDRISIGEYVLELTKTSNRLAPAPAVALPDVASFPQMPALDQPEMKVSLEGESGVLKIPAVAKAPDPLVVGNLALSGSDPMGQPAPDPMLGAAPAPAQEPLAMPNDLKGRLLWVFENRIMPYFFQMNFKYEWKIICGVIFGIFVLGSLLFSIYPLIEASRNAVIRESARRARYIAIQIAEKNAGFLAQQAETKTEIGSSIQNADGVRLAFLVGLDSRVIAPAEKMNQYLTTGPIATLAVKAKELFVNRGREYGIVEEVGGHTVVAVEPVKILSTQAGRNVTVAMAIVALDTTHSTPSASEIAMVFAENMIIIGAIGFLLCLVVYRLTLKPFQVLNDDIDKVLKGDMSQVTHEFKFEELDALWDVINSALQRVSRGPQEAASLTAETSTVDECAAMVRMLGPSIVFGLVICDQERRISYINPAFEEISGIRAENGIGHEIAEVARDQAFGNFSQDLFERAPSNAEGVSESFEFSGINYKVSVVTLGTPGSAVKGYVMAAVRAEEGS